MDMQKNCPFRSVVNNMAKSNDIRYWNAERCGKRKRWQSRKK